MNNAAAKDMKNPMFEILFWAYQDNSYNNYLSRITGFP